MLWRKQNQFKSRGFRGKKEVGTTDREISVPDIALSQLALTILVVIASGADSWRTQLIGSKGTEITSRSTGINLQFMTPSQPN